ncbi:copper chaperone PCu(A)C [Sulfuricella sp.]|uniref:copper chaperone PCu(A)C n=1 Tax=Sulfuricella sp. TaxID=2099377 RepID=UPI002B67833B|nr:copper chaperone PCu(A)C [Sulfuricella sp.]HUX63341.1 copper chaperone PCu(A)C [Sulfuricella sp.]
MTTKFHSIRIAACVLATLIAAPVLAGSAAESVSANEPFVRMTPPGTTNSGAFMVLKNADSKDHKLVKAESPVAKAVELHTHTNEGGVMKMRPVKDIEIKSKGEAVLKPGSLHVMLIGLKQDLKEGDNVAITLTFEDGSSKKVEAPVRKIQTEMKMEMTHDHEGMKH